MTSPLDKLRASMAGGIIIEYSDAADLPEETPSVAGTDNTDWNAAIAEYQQKIDAMLEKAQEQNSKLPFTPHAAPGSSNQFYQVQQGDTLESIAALLGLASPYHDLFQPNMAIIEEGAKAHGSPGGSDQGAVLKPGIYLEYRPVQGATVPS